MVILRMVLIRILFLPAVMLWLFGACKQPAPQHTRVLTDTLFYNTLSKVPELQFPLLIDEGWLTHPKDKGYYLWNEDSTFQFRYICEYDNFCDYCDGCFTEHSILGKKQVSDSVYIIAYETVESGRSGNLLEKDAKIILLTFNINRSQKTVDRLLLYSMNKGRSQMVTYLSPKQRITTLQTISKEGCQKPLLDDPTIPLELRVKEYQLLPSGQFDFVAYTEAYTKGDYTTDGHFRIIDSTDVRIGDCWQLVTDSVTHKKKRKGIAGQYIDFYYEKFQAKVTREGKIIITDSVRKKNPA